jgi:hypothetical protein
VGDLAVRSGHHLSSLITLLLHLPRLLPGWGDVVSDPTALLSTADPPDGVGITEFTS